MVRTSIGGIAWVGVLAVAACLVFSGLAALVYQVIWTRLLGFAFGTTTEAIAHRARGLLRRPRARQLARGAPAGARRASASRVRGARARRSASSRCSRCRCCGRLDALFALVGAPTRSPPRALRSRLAAAALLLLPPTLAMGATLPVVARGLVARRRDARALERHPLRGEHARRRARRLSLRLLAAPGLGLTARCWSPPASPTSPSRRVVLARRPARRRAPPRRAERASRAGGREPSRAPAPRLPRLLRRLGLRRDRLRDRLVEGLRHRDGGDALRLRRRALRVPPRHRARQPRDRAARRPHPRPAARLRACCTSRSASPSRVGMRAVPYLPFALRAARGWHGGGDAVHLLFLLVLPIVLLPTALFGAAFPVLIRIYTRRAARVGRGHRRRHRGEHGRQHRREPRRRLLVRSRASAWTRRSTRSCCSTSRSRSLVLLRFQPRAAGAPARPRRAAPRCSCGVASPSAACRSEKAIAGRSRARADARRLPPRARAARRHRGPSCAEGRASIVTVYVRPARAPAAEQRPARGRADCYAPPYSRSRDGAARRAAVPARRERPKRALVIGLGGANTVRRAAHTELAEHRRRRARAAASSKRARCSTTDARRRSTIRACTVASNDGRNELLLRPHRGRARYDVIASQPSHPWLVGAANLFTEEYFRSRART